MNIKKIIWGTIAVWLASTIFGFVTCGWLFNWVYAIPPIIAKAPQDMMIMSNMVGAHLTGIFHSFFFVLVFAILFKGIPGTGLKKGLAYGLLVWLVGALGGIAMMGFYTIIAPTLIVYWILQALVCMLICGAIVGVVYK